MNKTIQDALDYVDRLLEELGSMRNLQKVQIFIIPPFTCLSAVKQRSSGKFWVGAQNMHSEKWGAFTGEISAPMLKDLGVDMVELGHAERRKYFNENDVAINRKVQLALKLGIRPLICVGESAEEKDFGVEQESVARQIKFALNGVKVAQLSSIIVAYEPTWAIGNSGSAAEPGYIRIMSNHIRQVLRSLFGKARALIPVIYGGTVNNGNAGQILAQGGLDGLFIGRAAWDAEAFANLIRISVESVSDYSSMPPKLMARTLQKEKSDY